MGRLVFHGSLTAVVSEDQKLTKWDCFVENMLYFLTIVDPEYLRRTSNTMELADGLVHEFYKVAGMSPQEAEVLQAHLESRLHELDRLARASTVSEQEVLGFLEGFGLEEAFRSELVRRRAVGKASAPMTHLELMKFWAEQGVTPKWN